MAGPLPVAGRTEMGRQEGGYPAISTTWVVSKRLRASSSETASAIGTVKPNPGQVFGDGFKKGVDDGSLRGPAGVRPTRQSLLPT